KLYPIGLGLVGMLCWLASSPASDLGFDIGNYQVISSARVGRTAFQYVLSVSITNRVASASGVTAQVYSTTTNTTIVEGTVGFGDLAFGADAVSTNSITIIQDRLAAFDPSQLLWYVSVKTMALSLTVDTPISGLLTNGTNVFVSGTVG